MSEVGAFTTGDLLQYVGFSPKKGGRFYLALRIRHPMPGYEEWECWDPMIRGYVKLWGYELRVVARYADLIHSEHNDVD